MIVRNDEAYLTRAHKPITLRSARHSKVNPSHRTDYTINYILISVLFLLLDMADYKTFAAPEA